VITTREGSLGEVAGDAGVLVDPDDRIGMATAVRRLANDCDHRREVIARGLARAQLFSCVQQARDTLRVYREALA